MPRMLRKLILLLVLAALGGPTHAAGVYQQDAVKAAFLYRFSGFVEWPPAAKPRTSFTIAVLGSEGVARELEALLPNHTVNGVPAKLARLQRIEELNGAQMLYVGRSYTRDLRTVVEALRGKPVLVVTDRERGLDDGAAVNFLMADRRLRFEVALPAAQRNGLKLGSGMLAVAARVRGGPQP